MSERKGKAYEPPPTRRRFLYSRLHLVSSSMNMEARGTDGGGMILKPETKVYISVRNEAMMWCHGNRLTLRVIDTDILGGPIFGYYGPRGGARTLSLRYQNPDWHRRYIPGKPRTKENFAEPPPWPHLRVCPECGAVLSGGFRPANTKAVIQWLKEADKQNGSDQVPGSE